MIARDSAKMRTARSIDRLPTEMNRPFDGL
jgi:hypothetical protein